MDLSQGDNQVLTVEALLHGGESLKGTKYLQAVTLYNYKNYFIVCYHLFEYLI
jgi:hypothetical protein